MLSPKGISATINLAKDLRFTIVERGKESIHLRSLVGRGQKKLPMGSDDLASWAHRRRGSDNNPSADQQRNVRTKTRLSEGKRMRVGVWMHLARSAVQGRLADHVILK